MNLRVLLPLLPVLAYVLLPTRNPTGDAWYYAACSRWGEELLQPHHLLYNGIGWLWLRMLGATGAAPAGLAAMAQLQLLNALAAGGCLLPLAWLLERTGVAVRAIPAWLLVVGSTFCMMRFATENETYIQPLLVALLASAAWTRGLPSSGNRKGWLMMAGLLTVAACLIHQLMVWWALGLLLGLRPWSGRKAAVSTLWFSLPGILVPLAYGWAAPGGPSGIMSYIMHDYLAGGAKVEWGWRSLMLTAISSIRSVVQVHGNMLALWQRWPLALGLAGTGSLLLGSYALLALLGRQFRKSTVSTVVEPDETARQVRRTHLLIGGLQLGFAVQASGNAEFMVMLPALAAIGLAGGRLASWPARQVVAMGLALLSWNLAFGLVPAHYLDYTGSGPVWWQWVLRRPQAWVLLTDPNLLRNQLQYHTGRADAVPRVLGLTEPTAKLKHWLTARLAAGDAVYTDALGSYQPLNRARLTQENPATAMLSGFEATRVDSLPTFFGPRYISRLGLPASLSSGN